jgi:hypothetical protein
LNGLRDAASAGDAGGPWARLRLSERHEIEEACGALPKVGSHACVLMIRRVSMGGRVFVVLTRANRSVRERLQTAANAAVLPPRKPVRTQRNWIAAAKARQHRLGLDKLGVTGSSPVPPITRKALQTRAFLLPGGRRRGRSNRPRGHKMGTLDPGFGVAGADSCSPATSLRREHL